MEERWIPDVIQHDVNYPQHMEFKIETDVPVPARHNKQCSELAKGIEDAIAKLGPGQSFLIPEESDSKKAVNNLAIVAKQRSKKLGVKVITRTIVENGRILGLRVWRIESEDSGKKNL